MTDEEQDIARQQILRQQRERVRQWGREHVGQLGGLSARGSPSQQHKEDTPQALAQRLSTCWREALGQDREILQLAGILQRLDGVPENKRVRILGEVAELAGGAQNTKIQMGARIPQALEEGGRRTETSINRNRGLPLSLQHQTLVRRVVRAFTMKFTVKQLTFMLTKLLFERRFIWLYYFPIIIVVFKPLDKVYH
jgi:hypothetical protein